MAELRETLADLRAVLDRLEKAIDAAETPVDKPAFLAGELRALFWR
ncbi:transmembrane protein [Mycobacterium tuberculosis variant bovis BCG]|nr:transmembrane protein [Mycobacterium tuberculosis variant bovis BCG]